MAATPWAGCGATFAVRDIVVSHFPDRVSNQGGGPFAGRAEALFAQPDLVRSSASRISARDNTLLRSMASHCGADWATDDAFAE